MNFKHIYTSSEDIARVCRRRRSAFNTVNKALTAPNESTEFIRAQLLQRKRLGGTTIFITLAEEPVTSEPFIETLTNSTTNQTTNSTSNTSAGNEYIKKCPFSYKRKTVLPLTNKF